MNPDLLIAYAHVIADMGVIREIVSGPRDGTRLDSLQILTKWINATPNAGDGQQSDRGARKG